MRCLATFIGATKIDWTVGMKRKSVDVLSNGRGAPQARLSVAERKRLKKARTPATTVPARNMDPLSKQPKQSQQPRPPKLVNKLKPSEQAASPETAGGVVKAHGGAAPHPSQPAAGRRARGSDKGQAGGGHQRRDPPAERAAWRDSPAERSAPRKQRFAPRWEEARAAAGEERVEALTRSIASMAQQKQLQAALRAFEQLGKEGLLPTAYTFSNLLNAHINCGDVQGAEQLLGKMKEAGFAPNVVVYTTMLKGYGAVGAVHKALALLRDMQCQSPPVPADARTLNTFLRGCVRVGDVEAAREVFASMAKEWRVIPDLSANKYMSRLLSQGLLLDDIDAIRRQLDDSEAGDKRRFLPPCMFWAEGKCDRGLNCKFYHNPAIVQEGAEEARMERLDCVVEVNLNLAHAAALLGRWEQSNEAIKRTDKAFSMMRVNGSTSQNATFRQMNRKELESEVERVRTFLRSSGGEGAPPPDLPRFLKKLFIFSSVLGEDPLSGAAQLQVAEKLVSSLLRTAGLDQCVQQGKTSVPTMTKHITKCLSKKGRLLWHKVHRSRDELAASEEVPVKLEICSGNGDWVVAQAKAEGSRSNWVALELKHDRVYSIFSRMVLEGVGNLCVIGGDAAHILPRHFARGSVSHICINFPEPPHHSGDDAAESKLHLLTADFFRHMHRVLRHGGKITVFSDNRVYCQSLCKTVGMLRGSTDVARLYKSARVEATSVGGETSEVHGGIKLYDGIPGKDSGHVVNVTSYFDRFWEHGNHTDRVFFVIQKLNEGDHEEFNCI